MGPHKHHPKLGSQAGGRAIRRGEGGEEWLGAAFIALMVARVLFPLAPILEGHDHLPTEGDHQGPHYRPSSTLAPTDVDGLVLRVMPITGSQP